MNALLLKINEKKQQQQNAITATHALVAAM